MAATSSLALVPPMRGAESVELNGYSPGNLLSKIDGLDLLNLWGEQPEVSQKLYKLIEAVLTKSTRQTFAEVSRDPVRQPVPRGIRTRCMLYRESMRSANFPSMPHSLILPYITG